VSLGTKAASGANIDFTDIPDWATRVTIVYAGVSTNAAAASILSVRVGTEDGVVATGYAGAATTNGASSVVTLQGTASWGFITQGNAPAAPSLLHGVAELVKGNGNTWSFTSKLGRSDGANMYMGAGSIALAKPLTSVRLTTTVGTDVYDAGEFTVYYE
jgi:hypothetical protein